MTQQQRLDLAFRRVIQLLKTRTGNLASLNTTNKTDLVSAINEIQAAQASATNINDTTPSATTTYSSNKTNSLLAGKLGTGDALPAAQLTGTIDPARIPTINFFKPLVSTAATIPALSTADQNSISADGKNGTYNAVTLSDGSTYVYVSGAKNLTASYILLTDTTPDFSLLANKPTTVSGYGITDAVATGNTYSNPSWITGLAWSKILTTPTTLSGYGITDAATSAQLATKENSITAGTTAQYWRGDKTFQTLNSAAVGLGNVTNNLQVFNSGGIVSLAAGTLASRPAFGTTGRLYYGTDTQTMYYDTGSAWVLLRPAITGDISIPVGTTTATLATVNSNVGTFGSGTSVPVITANGKGLITAVTTSAITPAGIGAEPSVTSGTTSQYYRGDKTFQTLNATAVGLSNVVNSLQMINAGGAVSHAVGLLSARPTVGTAGRFFTATDTLITYYDNGTTWLSIEPALTGDVTSSAGSTATTLATVNSNVGSFGSASNVAAITVNAKGLVTAASNVAITPAAIGAAALVDTGTLDTDYVAIINAEYAL